MQKSVYVLPSPSCFADCDYNVLPIPPRSPQGGFPPPPSARVAPASRFRALQLRNRTNTPQALRHCSSRSGSLHRSSVKVRRLSPRQNRSHARHADATGTPSWTASPRPLSFAISEATGSFPFSFHPPRFYLHGSRSSRSCLTAIHLEPLRFYLFGRLEKITQGVTRLFALQLGQRACPRQSKEYAVAGA